MYQRFYRALDHSGRIVIINADLLTTILPLYDKETNKALYQTNKDNDGDGLWCLFKLQGETPFHAFVPDDFDLYSIVREKDSIA